MKKLFLLIAVLFCSSLIVCAKKEAPDPLYLSTPVKDYSKIEIVEKKEDPRTLKEKMREKLHLPKSKKVYLHNKDQLNPLF